MGFFQERLIEIEGYCNKCNKLVSLNDLELDEFKKEGSFVCSDCINKEMEEEDGK